MEEFGLRGEEPAAVAGLRSMVKEQDPEIYRLIVSDDAIVQRFMADPARAWKDAQGISPELAEVAGKVTSGSRRARREQERRQLAEEAEGEGEPVAA